MSRTSKLALMVGCAAVLVLGLGLVLLTGGAGQPATASLSHDPAMSHSVPAAATPAPAVEVRAAPSAARERSVPPAPRERVASPVRQPELAPAPAGFTRELKRDANGKLMPIVAIKELQEQLPRTDGPLQACIERSKQRPTGNATLSFTVAAKNNKLVIETTGVQDEETLAGYPELLECMHQTANALVLDGYAVRALGTPIYVRRHVRLEDGAVAENSIFNFSYNP
jgi:hypothetical protein